MSTEARLLIRDGDGVGGGGEWRLDLTLFAVFVSFLAPISFSFWFYMSDYSFL